MDDNDSFKVTIDSFPIELTYSILLIGVSFTEIVQMRAQKQIESEKIEYRLSRNPSYRANTRIPKGIPAISLVAVKKYKSQDFNKQKAWNSKSIETQLYSRL